jgi:hypothetical protein
MEFAVCFSPRTAEIHVVWASEKDYRVKQIARVWNVALSYCLCIQPLYLHAATVRHDACQRPSFGVGREKKVEINNYMKKDWKRERRGKIEGNR